MSAAFLDSNILLYGYKMDDPRSRQARELIEAGGAISVQCLNEFASVAHRKLRMAWPQINDALSIIRELCQPLVPLSFDVHSRGLRLAERYRLSVYDGMILSAAVEAGCDIVYSEDMQAGLVIDDRLRIVNPFA